MNDLDFFLPALDDSDPINHAAMGRALAQVQRELDLPAVVAAYGGELEERGDGSHKGACFLPSTVEDFAGTCGQQDGGANFKIFTTDTPGILRWHCYSCKRGGDVTDLIAHVEGWAINDSRNASLRGLRRAAQLAGCAYILDDCAPREGDKPRPEFITPIERRAVRVPKAAPTVDPVAAHALNYRAAAFFAAALASPAGAGCRAYLAARGVTTEQADAWGIGYADPAFDSLKDKIKDSARALAVSLGLLTVSRKSNTIDGQINRCVFPYMVPAPGGFVVSGFAGRSLDPSGKWHKWHNSKTAPGVYDKRAAMVGVLQSLEAARELGRITVCEGAFDALAFDRIGVPAVALVAAGLGPEHAAELDRVFGYLQAARPLRITLALDGDTTGRARAAASIAALLGQGFELDSVDVVDCEDGEDPATTDPATLRARWDAPEPAPVFLARLGVSLPASKLGPFSRLFELLAAPDQARTVAAVDLLALVGDSPARARAAARFATGETTDTSAMVPELRAEWLRLTLAAAVDRMTAEGPPKGKTTDELRAAITRSIALRAEVARIKAEIKSAAP